MGEIRKVNPYTKKTMPVDEPIEIPHAVKEYIRHCDVADEITPEEAKKLRLENLSILNQIINDVTVSATTRVQAIQAREKILKDLMGNVGTGINQRSLSDLHKLLEDDSDVTSEVAEFDVEDTHEEEIEEYTEAKVSVEDIKQQMLEDDEE